MAVEKTCTLLMSINSEYELAYDIQNQINQNICIMFNIPC